MNPRSFENCPKILWIFLKILWKSSAILFPVWYRFLWAYESWLKCNCSYRLQVSHLPNYLPESQSTATIEWRSFQKKPNVLSWYIHKYFFFSPKYCWWNHAILIHVKCRAVQEDEISVKKSENVTILSSNLSRGYLVHRPATSQVPSQVLSPWSLDLSP